MYARIVRFTDINAEQIDRIAGEAGDGPPPGVPAKKMQMVVDGSQNSAVALIWFETEEDMRQGDEALSAMDASETPGTRVSVDQGEVKIDADL